LQAQEFICRLIVAIWPLEVCSVALSMTLNQSHTRRGLSLVNACQKIETRCVKGKVRVHEKKLTKLDAMMPYLGSFCKKRLSKFGMYYWKGIRIRPIVTNNFCSN